MSLSWRECDYTYVYKCISCHFYNKYIPYYHQSFNGRFTLPDFQSTNDILYSSDLRAITVFPSINLSSLKVHLNR